jgi:hypothetical protein
MENRIPLRSEKEDKSKPETTAGTTRNSAIHLKGQMKWISSWNMIAFFMSSYVYIFFYLFQIVIL